MGVLWHLALGCLCILAASALPAPGAESTQDAMVVARADEQESSTEPATAEHVTDEPSLPIKLTEMTVTSDVTLRYAHTAVVTHVRNPAKKSQEATFRVLLPETAFISGFTMTLDGKSYKAYVKEKEEAKQIYNQAVSQGLGAAHVAAKARDSNQFTVSVNVEPNTMAVFNLTYEELLVRRNGVYNHAINLHPGGLVPQLTVTVNLRETSNITALRVPEIRTGNEIDASAEDAQNTKAVIERNPNGREAKITFKPDLVEQQQLIDVYYQKTKDTVRDWREFGASGDDSNKNNGVIGQFVVQYDVDRPRNGDILVNDGYFVHFFAPADLPPLNKHVVFVLDTSGSMMDRKIVQLRDAMRTILGELNAGDYFSIVEFASNVKVHELKEADQKPKPSSQHYYGWENTQSKVTLVPPYAATPENIEKAKIIVSRLDANGGTNIYSALDVAVNLIKKGVGWTQTEAEEKEEQASTTAEPAPTAAAVVAPQDSAHEESMQLEPIIIFLTDGDPTVGVTDTTRIVNHLTEKNSGHNKATIFSLAFGEDADRKFLRKLSLRNDGFMRHIYEAADAALQLRDFYRQVASPLLADVKFVYPKKQVKELTKHEFPAYYGGSETVVAGRVEEGSAELTPHVLAFCGNTDGTGRSRFEVMPRAPVPVHKDKYLPLERLWAYLTIKQLLDERDAADQRDDDADDKNTPEKKALAIALKYEFVTPLTSLVVVKPNATDAVNAESVHKQNNYPAGLHGFPGMPLAANFAGYAAARPTLFSSPFGPPLPAYAQYPSNHRYQSVTSQAQNIAAALPGQSALQFEEEEVDYDAGPGSSAYSAKSSPTRLGASSVYYPLSLTPSIRSDQIYAVPSRSYGYGSAIYGVPSQSYGYGSAIYGVPSQGYSYGSAMPASFGISPSTTMTSYAPSTEAQSTTEDTLAPYHLEKLAWVKPLLDATKDVIALNVNGTTVQLKLSTDNDAPRSTSGSDEECPRSTAGAGGVCVYLTRCADARDLTADTYSHTYCLVQNQFAGVCCPQAKVDVKESKSA